MNFGYCVAKADLHDWLQLSVGMSNKSFNREGIAPRVICRQRAIAAELIASSSARGDAHAVKRWIIRVWSGRP